MPERLLKQTWSIRTTSPFSSPWEIRIHEQEIAATSCLRKSLRHTGKVERDGTYVTIDWVDSEHLLFEIYVADEPMAQLVLCLAKKVADEGSGEIKVEKFQFCLVHGDQEAYLVVLRWIEQTTSCLISKHNFHPTSRQLGKMLYGELAASYDSSSQMQLEVTYGTPRVIKNLNEISIFIPSNSLKRVLSDMEDERSENEDYDVLLLRAARLFILEDMKLDVEKFPLIRVAIKPFIFSAAGSIRIQDKACMETVLKRISMFIQDTLQQKEGGQKRSRSGTVRKDESESSQEETLQRPQKRTNHSIQAAGTQSRQDILAGDTEEETEIVAI